MEKRTILILLIISTIFSIAYILLSYFGIIRLFLMHVYKPESYIKTYSKLSNASDKKKTKIVLQSTKNSVNKIKPFLNSILDQTCKVQNIIILLPDNNIKIPKYLSKFTTIVKGSNISNLLKKQKDADTILLQLQDNVVYGKDFIEKIIKKGIESNKHVCGKYSKLYQIDKIKDENLKNILGEYEKFTYNENFKRL